MSCSRVREGALVWLLAASASSSLDSCHLPANKLRKLKHLPYLSDLISAGPLHKAA